MSWQLNFSAPKSDLKRQYETELTKYEAINYGDGDMKLVWTLVEKYIAKKEFRDGDTVSVVASGGDSTAGGKAISINIIAS